jgi:hypothetical protein
MSLIRAVFALVLANFFAAVASAYTFARIGSSDVAYTTRVHSINSSRIGACTSSNSFVLAMAMTA